MQEGIDKAEREAYRRGVHGWHEPVIHQGEMKYQHVFEAGEDGKVIPVDVKKGDKVLFGKYAGTEIKIDGQEYLIMREDDILGIIG